MVIWKEVAHLYRRATSGTLECLHGSWDVLVEVTELDHEVGGNDGKGKVEDDLVFALWGKSDEVRTTIIKWLINLQTNSDSCSESTPVACSIKTYIKTEIS